MTTQPAPPHAPQRLLLVTGMSGAGKSTALNALEDLGWEVVDNLPLTLLDHLLSTPPGRNAPEGGRPLAIGVDTRTRNFDADRVVSQLQSLAKVGDYRVETLYLDCGGVELVRRFSETRRRHPLALDRPAEDGLAREREITAPLRRFADQVIDTTDSNTNALAAEIRQRFGEALPGPVLTLMSFGFARGIPRNADTVFDMRFLRNPHWVPDLRPQTGTDDAVAAYVAADPLYAGAMGRIEDLLTLLLPGYRVEGKSYVTVAFGCTGGRHRSVRVALDMAGRLRAAGFSPTVLHRDLAQPPRDMLEGVPRDRSAV
jgi:UPF0042 nucleotide-binding protein